MKFLRSVSVQRDNSRVGEPRAIALDCWRPEGTMTEISALFWDNGGVILTNGWDRASRRAAVEKFHLDWADFEDRHELMLNAFETGRASLDEYLRRTIFYRERPFTPDDFKQFMFEQSQPFVPSLEFLGTQKFQRRNERLGLFEHELFEIVRGEGALAIKNCAAQIFIEAGAAGLEGVEHQFVAIFEIGPIEVEFLDGASARVAVPAVS